VVMASFPVSLIDGRSGSGPIDFLRFQLWPRTVDGGGPHLVERDSDRMAIGDPG
jgi:hypothetical protein